MNTPPNYDSTAAPKDESNNSERDPTPSEVLAIILRWLREYGPNWLRRYWDKERPKSKWHEITMVILTVVIAGAAIYSAWVFQGQLSLMRDADRPWVKVDITVTSPLTYDRNGMNIGLTFILTNVGKSPADNVSIAPRLVTAFMGDDLEQIQKRICENRAASAEDKWLRYVLFPGDPLPQQIRFQMSTAEVDSHWNKFELSQGPIDLIPVALVGCVDYTYRPSPRHHQTGFAVDVVTSSGGMPLKSMAPIIPSTLALREHARSGHFAN
jgi:hypothetical protein